MKFNKRIAFITIVLFAIGFLGLSYQYTSKETIKSPAAHNFNKWMKKSDAERLITLRNESKKEISTVEEADQLVKYNLKYPAKNLNKKLLGIFLSHAQERMTLFYEGGLYIEQLANSVPPDFAKLVEEDTRAKEEGILLADRVPVLLKVNGYPGYGNEPGYNDFGDSKEPRPGFVQWYEDGANYHVYGDNIPLSDLIQIAESMKNVSNKNP